MAIYFPSLFHWKLTNIVPQKPWNNGCVATVVVAGLCSTQLSASPLVYIDMEVPFPHPFLSAHSRVTTRVDDFHDPLHSYPRIVYPLLVSFSLPYRRDTSHLRP